MSFLTPRSRTNSFSMASSLRRASAAGEPFEGSAVEACREMRATLESASLAEKPRLLELLGVVEKALFSSGGGGGGGGGVRGRVEAVHAPLVP